MKLDGLTILIENTAGQGTAIGRSFEEVAEIIAGVEKDVPVGACIDTAHSFEAGYAIHTEEGLRPGGEATGRDGRACRKCG